MKSQGGIIQSFHLPFMPGAEAMKGKQIANAFRRHIHQAYIIGLVEQGHRIIDHAGGSVRMPENDLFLINPGQAHACCSENPSGHSYAILSIPVQAMQAMASQIAGQPKAEPFFRRIQYKDAGLADKLRRLVGRIEGSAIGSDVVNDFYDFFAKLIPFFSKPRPVDGGTREQKDSIKRVCDYIGLHFTASLPLNSLAEVACLSPFHFQREFKKHIGITPHEYVTGYRIRESKKLLAQSTNIANIATHLGFFDQSHFSRIFKKTVGVSPGAFYKFINRLRE